MPIATRNESRGRVVLNYHEGTTAKVFEDGTYEITLPYRRLIRGNAENRAAAEQAVTAQRDAWILGRWEAGSLATSGHKACVLCPLE